MNEREYTSEGRSKVVSTAWLGWNIGSIQPHDVITLQPWVFRGGHAKILSIELDDVDLAYYFFVELIDHQRIRIRESDIRDLYMTKGQGAAI
jgi:hypothetical protein